MQRRMAVDHNYSYVFNFEQDYDQAEIRGWMQEHWQQVCGFASVVYVVMIVVGQSYMASRPRFELRGLLAAWNIFLAVFSIMGVCRTLPEMLYTLKTQGMVGTLCIPSFLPRDPVSGIWTWLFVLSKVPELGDTVFIVLRKQELIFLHWYHHLTVMWYGWYSFSAPLHLPVGSTARWFTVMNFTVHSIMYSYFALKALRFKIPKSLAMVITSLQLIQMVVGCSVNVVAYQYKQTGYNCGVSYTNIKLSLLMYFSYFLLFARFFYRAYFSKPGSKAGQGRVGGQWAANANMEGVKQD